MFRDSTDTGGSWPRATSGGAMLAAASSQSQAEPSCPAAESRWIQASTTTGIAHTVRLRKTNGPLAPGTSRTWNEWSPLRRRATNGTLTVPTESPTCPSEVVSIRNSAVAGIGPAQLATRTLKLYGPSAGAKKSQCTRLDEGGAVTPKRSCRLTVTTPPGSPATLSRLAVPDCSPTLKYAVDNHVAGRPRPGMAAKTVEPPLTCFSASSVSNGVAGAVCSSAAIDG